MLSAKVLNEVEEIVLKAAIPKVEKFGNTGSFWNVEVWTCVQNSLSLLSTFPGKLLEVLLASSYYYKMKEESDEPNRELWSFEQNLYNI